MVDTFHPRYTYTKRGVYFFDGHVARKIFRNIELRHIFLSLFRVLSC
ncbi:hypothetical protein OA344_02400 [Pseudomonadota bacterium]|nr:hypothetical protein [Pseudomonadota bacterium]